MACDGNSKTPDNPSHFFCLSEEFCEAILFKVSGIMCGIEVRSNLGTRAFRNGQELMEFSRTISFKALCNIGHDGYRSTLNLTG